MTPGANRKHHGKQAIYVTLPDDVKAIHLCSETASNSWQCDEFSDTGVAHDNQRLKHRENG